QIHDSQDLIGAKFRIDRLALFLCLGLRFALAGNGQTARFDADLDLLLAEARHFSLDLKAFSRLSNVHMHRMEQIHLSLEPVIKVVPESLSIPFEDLV